MRAFQKILFPIDMSDSCTATVPFVEAMAKRYNASVTMLHVLEMPSGLIPDCYGGSVAVIDTPTIWKAETEAAQSYLTDRFKGLKVQRVMLEGDAARTIDDYARENGMDLIMLPTHGFGLFRTLLLGSVTAKVLHDTPVPVWTGVHVEDSPAVSPEFATIMCAVDRTEDSIPTMRFACRLAQDNHARLFLVHAVPGAEVAPEKYFDADLRQYLEQDARRTIAQLQENAGVAAPLCLGAGEVSHVVRDSALGHSADLVVMGRGRATRTLGRMRSNVYSIIRDSPCPVISV
ncbi:MAG: universal stress protein [Bryobacteraceae bacterium]|jgi:nucleotide-binding universal stress UspA family protein